MSKTHTITVPFILHITVNCYLIGDDGGFILIDTGTRGQRRRVESALEQAGCAPGALRLIVLTHGDFDHCGNAAYLRQKYATRVAMHPDDSGMVENGDMFWNRKQPGPLMKRLFGLFISVPPTHRFEPDVWLTEGDGLSAYGFNARVIELPGHSKGSIGVLTADGDLFCGDLLGNMGKPDVWSLIDDPAAAAASVHRLTTLPIGTIYPGHGKPFSMAAFEARHRQGSSRIATA